MGGKGGDREAEGAEPGGARPGERGAGKGRNRDLAGGAPGPFCAPSGQGAGQMRSPQLGAATCRSSESLGALGEGREEEEVEEKEKRL